MSYAEPSIVCIGSNLESRIALERLLRHGVNVIAVVTRPPGEGGGVSDYADLHALCHENSLQTIDTIDVNSAECVRALRDIEADYYYTLGWSQLFGEDLLASPREYVVGSHPSALPYGRGRAPVPWTVLEGLTQSAVSLFRMDAEADRGPLLLQTPFEIPERADAGTVYQLVAEHLGSAFVELYEHQRRNKELVGIRQDEYRATHRAKRSPCDGLLDFSCSAESIDRLVRAVTRPYPGAYTYFRDQRITVWQGDDRATPPYSGTPGQVLLHDGNRLLVQAGDRPLWLSGFEREGQPIPAEYFRLGSRFGCRVEDELYKLRHEVAELRALLIEIKDPHTRRGAA